MRGLKVDAVRFNEAGLVPVVAATPGGRVLMVAWADREALEASLETGQMHYRSRSRDALWRKGETSGHGQRVVSLHLDCDGDSVLAVVEQTGPACHTGAATCFHTTEAGPEPEGDADWEVLAELLHVVRTRRGAEGSYTAKLLADENLRHKKIAEESGELIRAAAKGDRPAEAEEAADLLYHLIAAVEGDGVPFEEVLEVLRRRRQGEA